MIPGKEGTLLDGAVGAWARQHELIRSLACGQHAHRGRRRPLGLALYNLRLLIQHPPIVGESLDFLL